MSTKQPGEIIGDLVDIKADGFEVVIRCKKCGSVSVAANDSRGCGGSHTGPFGSVELICKECGQRETVIEL